MDHLALKADPMPAYMIDILMDVEDQETARTILRAELRFDEGSYLDAAQKWMCAMVQDSTYSVEDRLNEMRSWHSVPASMAIIDEWMDQRDFSAAAAEFELMMANSTPGRNENADIESYYAWLELRGRLVNDEVLMDSMPQFYIDEMLALAQTYPNEAGGIRAAIVLNQFYDMAYETEPYVMSEPAINKSMLLKKEKKQMNIMQVYPDPAIDLVNIRLTLPEAIFKPSLLRIYDVLGNLVMELQVKRYDEMFTINTSSWAAGSYQVVLNQGGLLTGTRTLLITK